MSEHATDIAKFTSNVNADAVKAIVNYCGIALKSRDASMVSSSDPKELATIRDGFAAKKLGLTAEAADAGIKQVVDKMKGDRHADEHVNAERPVGSSGGPGRGSEGIALPHHRHPALG